MKITKDNYWKTLAVFNFSINLILILVLVVLLNIVNQLNETVYAFQNTMDVKQTETQQDITSLADIRESEPIKIEEPVLIEIDNPTPIIPEDTNNISLSDKLVDKREIINNYVKEICSRPEYSNVDQYLVQSVIQHESEYTPKHKTGNCMGLMQVSTRWHSDRAERLGVTDFFDPYSNILLGVDYLSELTTQYKDPKLVLMLYNMKHDTAFKLYADGKISWYAEDVLSLAEEYRKGE